VAKKKWQRDSFFSEFFDFPYQYHSTDAAYALKYQLGEEQRVHLACLWSHAVNSVSALLAGIWPVAVKMLPYLIQFIKKCYKCSFGAICEDTATINGTIVQQRGSFPSTLAWKMEDVIVSPD
jgi:hypothetical protein